jgi:nitronate monooxygenase
MNWQNRITQMLHIQFPFIQAPMLVVTTPQMVAAASEAGCLGMLPLGYQSFEKAKDAIKEVKQLTGKPFGVNVFAYEHLQNIGTLLTPNLKKYYSQYNLPFPQVPEKDPYTHYTQLVDLFIEEKISVVSFHFGIPDPGIVQKLKAEGIVLIATATCVKEAQLIEENNIDIVVAQGIEAGGNRGSFLNGNLPQVGLTSLIPHIKRRIGIPVIAAGAIMQAEAAAASFILGAEGVQMGSLFIKAKESGATKSWKEAITVTTDTTTILTNKWSGRYGRCIPTAFVQDLPDEEVYHSPVQQYFTSPLREFGRKNDIEEIQSFWAGQSAGFAEEKTTREILDNLIEGTGLLLSNPFQFNSKG